MFYRQPLLLTLVALFFLVGCGLVGDTDTESKVVAHVKIHDAAVDSDSLWVSYVETEGGLSRFKIAKSGLIMGDSVFRTPESVVFYNNPQIPSRAQFLIDERNVLVLISGIVGGNQLSKDRVADSNDLLLVIPKNETSQIAIHPISPAVSRCLSSGNVISLESSGKLRMTPAMEPGQAIGIGVIGRPEYPLSLACNNSQKFLIDSVLGEATEIVPVDSRSVGPIRLDGEAVKLGRARLTNIYSEKSQNPVFSATTSRVALVSMCVLSDQQFLTCLVNGFNVLDAAWIAEFDLSSTRSPSVGYRYPLDSFIALDNGKATSGIRKMIVGRDSIGLITMDGKIRFRRKVELPRI